MSIDTPSDPLEAEPNGAMVPKGWNTGPDRDPNLTFDGAPRCMATSRQHQRRCERAASPGLAVCKSHGASQSRKAARLRLEQLTPSAIATLAREMASADSSRDRQSAANSILDRAGWGRATKVEAVDAKERLLERLLEMRQTAGVDSDSDSDDDDFPVLQGEAVPAELETDDGQPADQPEDHDQQQENP